MHPEKDKEPLHTATANAATTDSIQVAELALLIDAMPPEYREDVLLSVLWLGTSNVFQESYLVSSIRNQLCDCLMEKTGTLHDLKDVRQLAHAAIHRRLDAFTTATDLEQITLAIHSLLKFLADAL